MSGVTARSLAAGGMLMLALLGGEAHAADPIASNVAATAGLTFRGALNGATDGESAVFDYDRDGDLDLLLSTHGSSPWMLMRNDGNGRFTEILYGTFFKQDRHGCVAADFGSVAGPPDGRPDLYCVVGACQGRCTKEYPNELWLQRPDGKFVDVARSWGVADPHGRGREAVALDFDRDGRIDLAVANETPSIFKSPNRLYRNLGGRFVEVTSTPVNRQLGSECVEAADIDGNGWTDLIFCAGNPGDKTRIVTYKNHGGVFSDVTAGTAYRSAPARQIELADVNRDGRPDLLITQQKKLAIWLNQGGGFPRETTSWPLQEGRDVAVGDVSLDGAPDIYVVQGKNSAYKDIMLLNNGSGTGFRSIAIPPVAAGDGDLATPIPNWRGTGRAAFLVTNGKWSGRGPFELITFSAR